MLAMLVTSLTMIGPAAFWNLLKESKWDAVAEALKSEPNLAVTTDGSMTVPTFLLFNGQEALAQTAADHKAALDIFEASELGRFQVLRKMITEHHKVESFSPEGFTPLHLAAAFHHLDCTALLLRHGAPLDVLSKGKIVKNAPVAAATFGGDDRCVEAILGAGADPDRAGEGGFTALHIAASNGRLDLVKLLVRFGAHANAETVQGKKPIDYAREGNHQDVIDFLQSKLL